MPRTLSKLEPPYGITLKEQGRMQMDEVALYEVKNGKIVKEQFFY